jgi:acyl carrier protein
MITRQDFIRIVRDELALPLSDADLQSDLDQVVDWQSVQIVRLIVALEKETGQHVPVSQLMEQRTLGGMYAAVASLQ